MVALTRRHVLAAASSLAVALVPRKPAAQPAQDGAGVEPGQLQLRDPGKLPATLRWQGADGGQHALADYAGRGMILNFWATWCAPCIAEMPSLAALGQSLAAYRIDVVPISTDAGGAHAVQQFYTAHGITDLGIWLDPQQAAFEAIGAIGLPTTLIIDRRGREVARVSGAADWQQAASLVQALCDSAG